MLAPPEIVWECPILPFRGIREGLAFLELYSLAANNVDLTLCRSSYLLAVESVDSLASSNGLSGEGCYGGYLTVLDAELGVHVGCLVGLGVGAYGQ